MRFPVALLFHLCVILYTAKRASSKFEFTNIKCTAFDPSFSSFEYCYLKAVNRSFKYMSLKSKLHKLPISKIKVNLAVLKRFNDYKPFMYNVTVDACQFLRNPKSNPVGLYLYSLFKTYSNMNHTCPYDHDLIVEKLSTPFINNHIVTSFLPFPEGDYILESNWFTEKILRAVVRVYGTLS